MIYTNLGRIPLLLGSYGVGSTSGAPEVISSCSLELICTSGGAHLGTRAWADNRFRYSVASAVRQRFLHIPKVCLAWTPNDKQR